MKSDPMLTGSFKEPQPVPNAFVVGFSERRKIKRWQTFILIEWTPAIIKEILSNKRSFSTFE